MEALAGVEYIEAEDVRRRPFRAAVAPLPSLQSALIDAVGNGRKGTPMTWQRAIRAELREVDYETLAPFVSPRQTLVPDTLLALPDPPGETLKDGIERIFATPVDELLAEVEACRATARDGRWDRLERDPDRWLRRYVGALLRAWKGFRPVWHRAHAALGREVERIGVATAFDAQLELADDLLADGSVDAGRWSMSCDFTEGPLTFPDTGLVLIPLVAGDGGSIIDFAESTIRRICYPVRTLTEMGLDEGPEPALEGLLGVPRAPSLRALDCPTSIGRLAEALQAVPSAATHHVSALEAAGLVMRERSGRQVLVRRTSRGEAIFALYDEVSVDSRRRRRAS